MWGASPGQESCWCGATAQGEAGGGKEEQGGAGEEEEEEEQGGGDARGKENENEDVTFSIVLTFILYYKYK